MSAGLAKSLTTTLSRTYAPISVVTTRHELTALANIGKAKSGPYRVLALGTSLANADAGAMQLALASLKKTFGSSRATRYQLSLAGGTTTDPLNGWNKQPYSGIGLIRVKGTSSSTALNYFVGVGDEVVIEWSRESDSAACEVLIDGASAGSFGSSGAQKFGMRTTFTTTAGPHTVTINPPASGAAYIEAVEIRSTTRTGIDVIDGTLGGSYLGNLMTAATATGAQIAPITTTAGAGVEATFGRDDVDLILHEWHVNDSGWTGWTTDAAGYLTLLQQGMSAAAGHRTPVLLINEPAGHYAMANDGGSATFNTRYEACKAHLATVAAATENVWLADWDTPTRITSVTAYAAAYYSATDINEAAGTYSGDFIHPDSTKSPSLYRLGLDIILEALGVESIGVVATSATAARWEDYVAASAAILPLSSGANGAFVAKRGTWYRDTAATNLRPALNTAITGAGTSDANGKYYLASNYSYGLSTTLVAGTKYMLTMKVGPNDSGAISIRTNTAVSLYDLDGNLIASPSNVTISLNGLAVGSVYVLAMQVGQSDTSSRFLTLNGRFYDVAITTSLVPLLGTAP